MVAADGSEWGMEPGVSEWGLEPLVALGEAEEGPEVMIIGQRRDVP